MLYISYIDLSIASSCFVLCSLLILNAFSSLVIQFFAICVEEFQRFMGISNILLRDPH